MKCFKTEKGKATLRIQHALMRSLRGYLDSREFLELRPPIIGPSTDPGIRGAGRATFDYYGSRFCIMSSMILYKQAALTGFDRIYSFSPCVRLEPPCSSTSHRHLAEFVQVDLEAAHATCEEIMELGEGMLATACSEISRYCGPDLAILGRHLRNPKNTLP
ncbi:MAG: hypothetical protein NT157_06190 [Candidatus Micrarchaeota archaeon]|nr:hypothetical protein [Candidatus Micrarchaeota archaeon]